MLAGVSRFEQGHGNDYEFKYETFVVIKNQIGYVKNIFYIYYNLKYFKYRINSVS